MRLFDFFLWFDFGAALTLITVAECIFGDLGPDPVYLLICSNNHCDYYKVVLFY